MRQTSYKGASETPLDQSFVDYCTVDGESDILWTCCVDVCSYEAQRMFIELDNLREAAKFKRGKVSRRPRILMTI
jgi:hypothetical protein